ncbi:MAG: hypothetical protein IH605_11915 [Burkholderiales bacterium]|nr:hypothetical protein [Burkholderiales bacterium]
MSEAPVRTTFRTGLITVAVILAGLAFAAVMLPRGFSDDLSRIGQGGNVVVLIHNKDSVQSLELMTLADAVRSDYAGKAEFLVADTSSGQGRTFVREQQAGDNLLIFFGPDGTRRGALQRVKDEQALRLAIDQAFRLTR